MCGGAVQNVTTTGTVHEATVSRLTPNTSLYTFRVAAVHNQNVGSFSHLVDLATSVGMQGDFEKHNNLLYVIVFNFKLQVHHPHAQQMTQVFLCVTYTCAKVPYLHMHV